MRDPLLSGLLSATDDVTPTSCRVETPLSGQAA